MGPTSCAEAPGLSPEGTGEPQQVLEQGKVKFVLWKGLSGCPVWESGGGRGSLDHTLGSRAVAGEGDEAAWTRVPPRHPPRALTGHTKLQGLGELGVLLGVVVLHPAAIDPALAPLHPLQGQVPLEIYFQHVFLLVLGNQG